MALLSNANPGGYTEMFHDPAGNLATVRTHGDGWRYDEVTTRDLHYRESAKDIRNSHGKGVKFSGHTSFSRDPNGNLLYFDRGRARNEFTGQGATRNSVASFTYDNDGQILTRADFSPSDLAPSLFEGSPTDPQTNGRWTALNNALAGTFKLNAYFHGQQHPLAEQSGDQTRALVTLALQGGVPVYDAPPVHP